MVVLLKNYITVQVLVLFSFNLLSADNKAHKDVRREAVIPSIVNGPGKIISVSPRTAVKKDEDKSLNDLLYEIYKKFAKDVKRHTSEVKRSQQKKGVIVNTDRINNQQKKTVEPAPGNRAASAMHTVKKEATQEEHKLALRELESTIDKLIESITQVSQDGKFEGKDINKDIEDLSKFADLSHLNIPTKEEKKNVEVESFDEFKERFYKTFLTGEQARDEQKIVYHGKKKEVTPKVIYHGKDGKPDGQFHDSNPKWMPIRNRDTDAPKKASDPQYQANSKKFTKSLDSKRIRELANLYENLKKQTAVETKARNVRKSFVKRTNSDAGRKVKVEKLKNDLISLLDVASSNDGNAKQAINIQDAVKYDKRGDVKEGENVERLKKDLLTLFDLIGNKEGNMKDEGVEKKQVVNKRRDESVDTRLKKELHSVVGSLESVLGKNDGALAASKSDDGSNIDNLASGGSNAQNELKKQLLTVVLSLQSELNKENGGDLPQSGGFQPQNGGFQPQHGGFNLQGGLLPAGGGPLPVTDTPVEKASIKTNDHFDSDLDNIVSTKESSNNKNYSVDEFIEALKGFAITPKSSDKKK